jgi:C-terminal processing protease CtpA/Prc
VTFLTEPQRRTVFDKVLTLVDTKFAGTDIDVNRLREVHEARVVNSDTAEDFEQALDGVLRDLKTSHTGLFHEARPRSGGRIAMAATLTKAHTAIDGHRWVFQDVHPGGVAAAAGIESGDVLLAVNDQDLVPPAAIPFRLGESYTIAVRKPDGSSTRSTLAIPDSREKKRPIVVPDQVVSARKLDAQVGYIRVSMFPGVLGMDVARDISSAIAELDSDRLIVDLRGNTGGGIGCLRLMSHLCADRRGVGYSVARKLMRSGYDKNRLPQFDRIPSSKLQVLPLIVKFGLAGRSVAVFTEALGAQRHHGQVAMLVNEHSASAAEMVAAFASEYKLATLVGTTTAGRLVATSAFKVGFGYRVVMPVATYFTWHGANLEGRGAAPTIEEPFSFEASIQGRDNQLERATQFLLEAERSAVGASA